MGALAEVAQVVPRPGRAQGGQFLTFMLGREVFALSIRPIKEILEYGQVTAVPMMPEFIRGVINLRGRVVPVVDLGLRFQRRAAEIGRRTCVLIVEVDSADSEASQDIGIIVDAVNEVVDVTDDEIEPPPSFGNSIRPDFISGMARLKGRFVVILDAGRTLSMEEMAAVARSLPGGGTSHAGDLRP